MSITYYVFANFGNMLLIDGPLCSSLINVWLDLAGSKHSHIFPFSFGPNKNCYIILICHPHLEVLWFVVHAAFLIPLWTPVEMHMQHVFTGLVVACFLL